MTAGALIVAAPWIAFGVGLLVLWIMTRRKGRRD